MDMAEIRHFRDLRGELAADSPLARFTSWRAGGRAEMLFLPADRDDLATFLRQLPPATPLTVLGLGSNTLVRDGGVPGAVVVTHNPGAALAVADGLIYADASVASPKLARFAAIHGCAEAEFLAGVPGTVGGALAMNAGAFGGETWTIVAAVETLDRHGERRTRSPGEYQIGYRSVRGPADEWFVAGHFALTPGDTEQGQAQIKSLLAKRGASQPTQWPNAGSVFRNPPGDYSARLIERAGLKDCTIGGASVSTLHANFIINNGNATARDIEQLIAHVQAEVERKHGIRLEPEVRVIGEVA